jgi:hypothetical protein
MFEIASALPQTERRSTIPVPLTSNASESSLEFEPLLSTSANKISILKVKPTNRALKYHERMAK